MEQSKELILFENKKIRRKEFEGVWYYSIIDIIEILTESKNPRDYWYRLKQRINEEEKSQLSTNCRQLKMLAIDGKQRLTDYTSRETIFR